MKKIKGLEHLSYEERLGEQFTRQSSQKTCGLTVVFQYLQGYCKKDGERFFTSNRIIEWHS